MATFIVRSEGCYARPLQDGLWAITNNDTSNIAIRSINIFPSSSINYNGAAYLELGALTSFVGGSLVTMVSPVASDPTAPGGLYVAPTSWVEAGLDFGTLPYPVSYAGFGNTAANPSMFPRLGLGLGGSNPAYYRSPVEGIFASNDRPVAIIQRGSIAPFATMMSITCDYDGSTKTAIFNAPIVSKYDGAVLAVLAPTVDMTIISVEFFDMQNETMFNVSLASSLRLSRLASVRGEDGQAIAVVPGAPIPNVSVAKNFASVPVGINTRTGAYSHTASEIQVEQSIGNIRSLLSYHQDARIVSAVPDHRRVVYEAYDADSALIVRPGECIGLCAGINGRFELSPYLTYNVECVFDFTPPAVIAGQRHHVIGSSIIGRLQ